MASSAKHRKPEFTEDDLTDMAFQSELFFEANQATNLMDPKIAELALLNPELKPNFDLLADQLSFSQNKALNIGHLTKFLTLFNENSAAARILSKEYQAQHLVTLC